MKFLLRCCVVVLLAVAPIRAQSPTIPSWAPKVDAAMAQLMAEHQTVGAAIGVIIDNKLVYVKGYGLADRQNKEPVTEKTMFRWASVSKTITAIAAMQLVDAGKLDPAADVRKYVPEFPQQPAVITTRDLLCHQSGMPHYTNGQVIPNPRPHPARHPYEDVVDAIDVFSNSPMLFWPGEKYSYSTYGFNLIAAAVQRAGGEPFDQQVQKRICKPLGITTIQPDYQWKSIAHRATGYRKIAGQVVQSTDTDVSWKLGGGGYISTIGDMGKYAVGLLEGGLVSPQSRRKMWTAQNLRDGKPTSYGLGFFVDGEGKSFRVAHSGSQEKAKTRLVIYPNRRRGMVFMTNCEWIDPGIYTTRIFSEISGESLDPKPAKSQ